MKNRQKLVSVVIPTYNRREMLCQCIDSVLRSTYKELEVIVVDNHSNDGTDIAVTEKYQDCRVKLVRLQRNLMSAGGRNEGIKKASGEYVLFLDNDNVVESDMIELLVAAIRKDPIIGLVGPISINKYNDNTIWCASGDYNFFTSRPRILYGGRRVDEVKLEKVYKTCYSPNAMMVRRSVIDVVGGFDKTYYAMYEEADFGYRIKKAGFQEFIVTDARTYHYGYINADEQSKLRLLGIGFPERAYYFAKNRSVFMKKYARWYHLIFFYCTFFYVFTLYYFSLAIRYGRKDIAKAWIKGSIAGVFLRVKKEIKVDI